MAGGKLDSSDTNIRRLGVSITDKLLSRLTRQFDRTPASVLGLRLSYQGGMTWEISDDVLTTTVADGGQSLSVDLSQFTVYTLANYLAAQPGYSILYIDNTGLGSLSALALVEGRGDIFQSNGDHLYVATNPNWALMNSFSAELELAQRMIELLPSEMATTTADGEWLDLLGSYYAVPRQLGEADYQFSPRIPAEVILPRQNNTAIALALQKATGQPAACNDARVYGNPEPRFDGLIKFDGSHLYNASAARIFNLFDIVIGYDLLGHLSPTDYLTAIRSQVDRLRAAGTHLRNLEIGASVLGDRVLSPIDRFIETWITASLIGAGTSSDSATGDLPLGQGAHGVSSDSAIAFLTTGESVTVAITDNDAAFTAVGSIRYLVAPVTFFGTGGFVGSSHQPGLVAAIGRFDGSGRLTGVGTPTQFAAAAVSGLGQFTSITPQVTQFASSRMSASGGFTGNATQISVAPSTPALLGLWVPDILSGGPDLANDESSLGRLADMTMTFTDGQPDWPHLAGVGWAQGDVQFTHMPCVFSVPMLPNDGSTLALSASGSQNSYYVQLAQALVQYPYPYNGKQFIRIAWEFNSGYPWLVQGNAGNTPANYIATWRNMVNAFRSVDPNRFLFIFCGNSGNQLWGGGSPGLCYPEDAYVDYIGCDFYQHAEFGLGAFSDQRYNLSGYGVQWWYNFAQCLSDNTPPNSDNTQRIGSPKPFWGGEVGAYNGGNSGSDASAAAYIRDYYNWIKGSDQGGVTRIVGGTVLWFGDAGSSYDMFPFMNGGTRTPLLDAALRATFGQPDPVWGTGAPAPPAPTTSWSVTFTADFGDTAAAPATTFGGSTFAWYQQGAASFSIATNLVLTTPGQSSNTTIHGLLTPIAGTGSYTAIMSFDYTNRPYYNGGLIMTVPGTGNTTTLGIEGSSTADYKIRNWSGANVAVEFLPGGVNSGLGNGVSVYLRIVWDGTNYTFLTSNTGAANSWTQRTQQAAASVHNPDHIGIFHFPNDAYSSGQTQHTTMSGWKISGSVSLQVAY